MDEKILHAVDLNFYHLLGAILANSQTGEVRETRALYLTSCGHPASQFNCAFLKLPIAAADADTAIESAERYFRSRKLPFRVSIRKGFEAECAGRLLGAGYREVKATPGMMLSPIRDPSRPHRDLEVRRVRSSEELKHFQETAVTGFGLPAEAGPIFLTRHFFELPNVRLYVGYLEGRPVCTSSLVATGEVAGIYWVATLEGFRRWGLGEAMTWEAVKGGVEMGCELASLQASEMGRGLYVRMGFDLAVEY
ncbi:GNAT family N-acetyltransferase, partial [bacterium]|nr:GNAT family N-acetyltransferase [bacterium]